jgi:quaternary ammonium compound-resistance protein SugE
MTAWIALIFAGLLEVAWALGIKYSEGFTRPWPTLAMVAALALSFLLFSLSLRGVPFGTAYAIWAGLGACGVVLAGIVLFGEPATTIRIAFVSLIVAGMIGLKLITPEG